RMDGEQQQGVRTEVDVVARKEQPQWKPGAKRRAEGRGRTRAPAGESPLPRALQRRRDAGRGWRGRVRPHRGLEVAQPRGKGRAARPAQVTLEGPRKVLIGAAAGRRPLEEGPSRAPLAADIECMSEQDVDPRAGDKSA